MTSSTTVQKSKSSRGFAYRQYILRRLLGYRGYQAYKQRDWTFIGLFILAIGLIADLSQIFGPITKVGLVLAIIATTILGFIILRRFSFCHKAVVPFICAFWMALVFGGFSVAQAFTPEGDEKGSILALLNRIDRTTQDTNAKVTEIQKHIEDVAKPKPEQTPRIRVKLPGLWGEPGCKVVHRFSIKDNAVIVEEIGHDYRSVATIDAEKGDEMRTTTVEPIGDRGASTKLTYATNGVTETLTVSDMRTEVPLVLDRCN